MECGQQLDIMIIFIHTRQCRTGQKQTQRIIQSINLSYVNIQGGPKKVSYGTFPTFSLNIDQF